ncbi:MAG: pyruvate dehydrogenase complex dihydrolipoamide acetyltransferase [Alphaproteobacteria bacterium]|nr:pyruvate dehydrogenase complex dihydrolipoamide acetyltransferase [Alphaproteobacteria bacterium]
MPVEVLMPALSPTMTEGKLAKWLVKEGDTITSGMVLAEIETDKATMEVEAVEEGTLGRILVPGGTENVAVNTPIALILEEGEDASALGAGAKPAPKAAPSPAAAPEKAAVPPASAAPAPPPSRAQAGGETTGRVFASPLARRIAAQAGLDLARIDGSGPHGRIVRADVEAAIAGGAAKAAAPAKAEPRAAAVPAAAQPQAMPAPQGDFEEVPLSSMRKTIARRLLESKQNIPHFYLTIDVELDSLLALRQQLNSRSDAYKLSVNDFVVRACALALKKVPEANAIWGGDKILRSRSCDVAVAVALDGGLITPIVRRAEAKGLAEISAEMKELAGRAKAGKLKPEEYQGGAFALSNLGMYGIREFAAVINPPHGSILAVGAGEQRPVVKNGALAVATVMSATLSCDHRVIDGALGARWLAVFKGLVEDPLTMLL